MNPRRSQRAAKPAQRTPRASPPTAARSLFPKWLIVLSCAAALIALNLLLFHRKLLLAFQETHAPEGLAVSTMTNSPGPAITDTNVGANSPALTFITQTDRDKALSLFTHGTELLEQKKFAEAVSEFEASRKLDPESEDTHYNLAFAFSKMGRTEDAIREYKEALRLLPDYAEAHNNLGNLLKNLGNLDEAVSHFNDALRIIPDHASARNNLGVALAQQGKINEATLHFAKAIELQPDYVDAHYNLGSAYLNQGRLDEAVVEFNKALRLKPDFQAAAQALMKAQRIRALERSPEK